MRGPAASAAALLLCASASSPGPDGGTAASPALIGALRATIPLNPISVSDDPYVGWRGRTPPTPASGSVCAVRLETDGKHYRLATFPAESQARSDGYRVTHTGACGTCSTLQDLAVYLERPDLTAPVRRCGMMTDAKSLQCLEQLGFTPACARTWFFNAQNTRRVCFGECVRSWISGEASTHDGELNDCLRCDEERSGPVFKAVAGRTRRNSGIVSSIPRHDQEVAHVVHDYFPDAGTVEPPR